MTTIEIENFSGDIAEISYNYGYSRPSKSLLTPDLYNAFKTIKDNNILPNLSREDLIQECISYIYDSHTLFEKNLLIFDVYFKLIDHNTFNNTIEEIKCTNKKHVAIIFTDIYTYPKVQFMYILSKYFTEVKLSMSQFYNFGILFCKNKTHSNFLTIKNKENVKDFNVKIPERILVCIKNYNNLIFKRIVEIDKRLNDMCYSIQSVQKINNEIEIINKYYKMYISKCVYTSCNNCKLIYSNFLDSCICEKCYNLFL